jgi:hypothetical protein
MMGLTILLIHILLMGTTTASSSSSISSGTSSSTSFLSQFDDPVHHRRFQRRIQQEWSRRSSRQRSNDIGIKDGTGIGSQQQQHHHHHQFENLTVTTDRERSPRRRRRTVSSISTKSSRSSGDVTPLQDIHENIDIDFALYIHSTVMDISRSIRQSKGHYYSVPNIGDNNINVNNNRILPSYTYSRGGRIGSVSASASHCNGDENDDTIADKDPSSRNRRNFLPSTQYGADPTGRMDSTASFQALLQDVLSCQYFPCRTMASGIVDLGGAVIDLEGGQYLISQPIYIPPHYGNIHIMNGSLRASSTNTNTNTNSSTTNTTNTIPPFPSNRWLIEIGNRTECQRKNNDPQQSCHEFINLHHLLLDGRMTAAGGIKLDRVMGTTVDTVFVVGFPHVGIQVNDGHEVMIINSWLAEWYWDHLSPPSCGSQDSIGIQLNGNDHCITNTIIFHCTKIGVQVNGNANLLVGVHTWNGGGVGIQLGSSQNPAKNIRLIDCYLDYNALTVYSPQQVTVENTFFLQTGVNIIARNASGTAGATSGGDGGTIRDFTLRSNSYMGGTRRPNPIEVIGKFTTVRNVQVVDSFSANKSTKVMKSLSLKNTTSWIFNFTDDLLFPGLIDDYISYSVVSSSDKFFSHMARRLSQRSDSTMSSSSSSSFESMVSVIEIVTSESVDATVHVTVQQGL